MWCGIFSETCEILFLMSVWH